jgi:hypothetical protein
VLRVYRHGQAPEGAVRVTRRGTSLRLEAASASTGEFRISFTRSVDGTYTVVQRGTETWRLKAPW